MMPDQLSDNDSLKPFSLHPAERITVCTRPFRAAGPRIEAERLGDRLVIHNYGHGGSGWSLSWGSAEAALALAGAGTPPEASIAVVGAGALGLTSAIVAQRAGFRVTIYARDLPPQTRSARATGAWTPDSRIALTSAMQADFPARWERLCRASWQAFQPFVSAPGDPIYFHNRYTLCGDLNPADYIARLHGEDPIGFAWLNPRVADLYEPPIDLGPGEHPFQSCNVRREHQMVFNIREYTQQLTTEFHARGGHFVEREFHSPAEFATLPERTLIHATGYGARQLYADDSLTPVRGQITWLPPQPESNYSVFTGDALSHLNIVSRRDGLVVQWSSQGEATGWQREGESQDRAESEAGLQQFFKMSLARP